MASVHHPFQDVGRFDLDDYFQSVVVSDKWQVEGTTFTVRFWHRPLEVIVNDFGTAGLGITRIWEPKPDDQFVSSDPIQAAELMRHPRHLLVSAVKV